jgi:predicted nucleotidyltransferase component of viral defense system
MTNAMVDISVHKNILFQILKDIYSDITIAPFLGFKGGTAAFIFYELNRFSIDLDFDLLDGDKENYIFDRIEQIAKKYGSIKEMKRKRFNLLFILSYEAKARKIKIEINRRSFGSRYELKTYLGISMLVMVKEDMFAHKLMAMYERIGKTSRDIYDVWFFLEKRWPINKQIVEQRANLPFNALLEKCIKQLEKMNNRNILDGLGDLLSEPQKGWARAKLRTETIFLLKARLESEKKCNNTAMA